MRLLFPCSFGFAITGILALQACDSSTTDPNTGLSPGVAPKNPGGPPPDGTGTIALAISKLYFGEGADGWKHYGLDIDGKTTTYRSSDVCILTPGAQPAEQSDGDNGIDNSFGENLFHLLTSVVPDVATTANAALLAGDATQLFALRDLGAGPSYSPLPGTLYRALPMSAPAWDGRDVRSIDLSSFVNETPATPALVFSGGYMNARTWVGTPPIGIVPFDLHFPTAGHTSLPLPLSHVQVVMNIDPTNRTGSGVISAVIATEDAVTWARNFGRDSPRAAFCGEAASEQLAYEIRQSADILLDGTNAPGQPCNAISFGIGFDAVQVTMGGPASAPHISTADPCDAGTGAD